MCTYQNHDIIFILGMLAASIAVLIPFIQFFSENERNKKLSLFFTSLAAAVVVLSTYYQSKQKIEEDFKRCQSEQKAAKDKALADSLQIEISNIISGEKSIPTLIIYPIPFEGEDTESLSFSIINNTKYPIYNVNGFVINHTQASIESESEDEQDGKKLANNAVKNYNLGTLNKGEEQGIYSEYLNSTTLLNTSFEIRLKWNGGLLKYNIKKNNKPKTGFPFIEEEVIFNGNKIKDEDKTRFVIVKSDFEE